MSLGLEMCLFSKFRSAWQPGGTLQVWRIAVQNYPRLDHHILISRRHGLAQLSPHPTINLKLTAYTHPCSPPLHHRIALYTTI
jgi:hypothetical protein